MCVASHLYSFSCVCAADHQYVVIRVCKAGHLSFISCWWAFGNLSGVSCVCTADHLSLISCWWAFGNLSGVSCLSHGTSLCTADHQPSVSIVERDGHQFVAPICTQHKLGEDHSFCNISTEDCVKQICNCSRHFGKVALHGLINY
jgi:hypothetical protein